jgi:nitrogen fixation NifU-like protein
MDHFRAPRQAGVLAGQGVVTARADTAGSRSVLQLSLRVSEGCIREARFKAYGCPSTIAAGSWLCEWLVNRPVLEAGALSAASIAKTLALAPVKRHCAVLAEDALRAALSLLPVGHQVSQDDRRRKEGV